MRSLKVYLQFPLILCFLNFSCPSVSAHLPLSFPLSVNQPLTWKCNLVCNTLQSNNNHCVTNHLCGWSFQLVPFPRLILLATTSDFALGAIGSVLNLASLVPSQLFLFSKPSSYFTISNNFRFLSVWSQTRWASHITASARRV